VEGDVSERVPELSRAVIAAFQESNGDVIVAFESPADVEEEEELERLCREVIRAASRSYPGKLHAVALRRGLIPRTTSGKVQRSRCRDMLADGSITPSCMWPERK
jgi:acyl-coenzyme A synthetase/AMP-(fatty) acid ligase